MAIACLVGWVAVCVDVLVHPEVDPVGAVDAVYVIGPVETRIEETLALMDRGVAPVLLATTSVNPDSGQTYATDHCGLVTDRYAVECVLPEPYTTRGEAQVLGEEAAYRGWDRVAVLTSTPHAARTRLLMERCTDPDVQVLLWTVEDGERGLRGWLGAFVYQSAAWVKTQVVRDC
ncbi:hypothetical protein [Ornithinimicrobium cerasi]|uniref:hypothetical protein n=1 Tax=Ornithinimicrobium cerasi TaxID=2248773 RepID=UPI00137A4A54|nr:hypothetical protein [Ornithinimicrobium cerasi]